MIFLFAAPGLATAPGSERAVLIVAGQSNALNWHASAAQLSPDARDAAIPFYHDSGAPPRGGVPGPGHAGSGGQWTTLGVQRQEPFGKYERDFFGPEISLARQLVRPPRPVAVIKIAYFGTTLADDWNPAATGDGAIYPWLRALVAAAMQQLRERGEAPHLGGFFWMQGETDGADATRAAAYAANLVAFVARVRADLAAPGLPFVLGRVGSPPPKGYEFQSVVRTAQVRVAESVPGAAWVDTDDLRRDTDGVHLLAPGVITLGQRMVEAWERLAATHHSP